MMHTDKSYCSPPTRDRCSFKHVCGTIAKEKRDLATVDLPGFFLQTESKDEELLLMKFAREVALFLVESNPEK